MSKYFVTSEPSHQYPFTFQDLRMRPPRKRSGFLLVTTACLSALCGGAAAYALMASSDDPTPVRVASLDTSTFINTAISANTVSAKAAEDKAEQAAAETMAGERPTGAATADQTVEVAVADVSDGRLIPLGKNNPRWSDDLEPAIKREPRQGRAKTVEEALRNVAIAETEEEVVALEEKMNPELLAMVSPDAGDDPAGAVIAEEPISPVHVSAPVFATGDLVPARATRWVNMRADARKGAVKMMVVPEDSDILSDPDCQHWCRVVYDGRLGYVYRTYIRFPGEGSVAASSEVPTETGAATESEGGFFKKLLRGGRADP